MRSRSDPGVAVVVVEHPMSEILSHQEATKAWVLLQQGGVTIDGGMEALDALWFSHEALRARLAEVEAERDDLAVDLGSTILRRKEAEARLAEVEQALRDARLFTSKDYIAVGRAGLVVQMGAADDILAAVLDKEEHG